MKPFSPEQFATDLTYLYRATAAPRLRDAYFRNLLAAFIELYINDFNPTRLPNQCYKLFLETCLDALTRVGSAIDPIYLDGQPVSPLFSVPFFSVYERDVDQRKEPLSEWYEFSSPNILPALNKIADAFLRRKRDFADLGLLTWETDRTGTFNELPPVPDKYRWRSDYRDAKKAYEKAIAGHYGAIRIDQQPFLSTPLFPYSYKLLPPAISVPFEIESRLWFEGAWIVGASGRGKTNLLRHLALHQLAHGSIIILDPKGDLRKSFERLASIKDRLVVIEPDLDRPPAINPLDMGSGSIEFLTYLFELLDTKMTPSQTALFRAVLALCEMVPGATVDTFREILRGEWKKHQQYVERLDPEDRLFFEKEFTERVYTERKPEVLLRLRLLMSNKHLRAMFQAKKTRVDLGKLMDARKIILFNNSYDPGKLGEDGSEFFGRMVIAMLWAAARRRASLPDDKKVPVFVFIDEAHFVIARDKTIKKILNQCRSQKIAMTFSHQELRDIEDPDVRGALTSRPIKFASSAGESKELGSMLFAPTPEFVAQQPRGSFACFVLEKTPQAVSISVPEVTVHPDQTFKDLPRMTDAEHQAVLRASRDAYCLAKSEMISADAPPPPEPSSAAGPTKPAKY